MLQAEHNTCWCTGKLALVSMHVSILMKGWVLFLGLQQHVFGCRQSVQQSQPLFDWEKVHSQSKCVSASRTHKVVFTGLCSLYRQIMVGGASVWEAVSLRLVPSMLMLSRLFNLPQILPDHKLPALLKTEVLRVHKRAVQAAASDAASDDSCSGDEMAEQKCTNCRKKRKEVRLLAAPVKVVVCNTLQLEGCQA